MVPFREVQLLGGLRHVSLGVSVLDDTPSIDKFNHIILISGVITLIIIRTM